MANWTNQSTDSLLPGEPWTSAKAIASFENPEAIAEGAAGAPKIQGAALGNVSLPWVEASGTSPSPAEYTTGVDRVDLICAGWGVNTANVAFQVSFSDDNGANWTSWQTIGIASSAGDDIGDFRISISDAECVLERQGASIGSSFTTTSLTNLPAGEVNGFRFRALEGAFLVKPYILAGAA